MSDNTNFSSCITCGRGALTALEELSDGLEAEVLYRRWSMQFKISIK